MQPEARQAATAHRTRSWLPDAQTGANPVGTWLLELGFDLWISALYRRELLFPEGFRIKPGTVIASNHQRDVDGPMIGTVLVRRRGLRFAWPLPYYATREDLFRPGILARLTVHWPRPVSALLGHVSLAWFFPLGHAEPMRRVREYTLGEALRALCEAGCGNDDYRIVLNARGRRELGIDRAVPLHALLMHADPKRLERWWGLRRLTLCALARIAPGFRATVDAQLAHFAGRLAEGHSVYFSPEGTLSRDGRLGRIREGFFRLCHSRAEPPWIQPAALSYDSLAPGRTRVVIRIGNPFRANVDANRCAFDAGLRRAIVALEPITPSHLLARFLLHGPASFTPDELADWFTRGLAALRERNASLDPLWTRTDLSALARRRLHWLRRKHLVVHSGGHYRNTCPRDVPPGWRTPANVVRFLGNSLDDIAPGLPPC